MPPSSIVVAQRMMIWIYSVDSKFPEFLRGTEHASTQYMFSSSLTQEPGNKYLRHQSQNFNRIMLWWLFSVNAYVASTPVRFVWLTADKWKVLYIPIFGHGIKMPHFCTSDRTKRCADEADVVTNSESYWVSVFYWQFVYVGCSIACVVVWCWL